MPKVPGTYVRRPQPRPEPDVELRMYDSVLFSDLSPTAKLVMALLSSPSFNPMEGTLPGVLADYLPCDEAEVLDALIELQEDGTFVTFQYDWKQYRDATA